jgi:hypothetical protein
MFAANEDAAQTFLCRHEWYRFDRYSANSAVSCETAAALTVSMLFSAWKAPCSSRDNLHHGGQNNTH